MFKAFSRVKKSCRTFHYVYKFLFYRYFITLLEDCVTLHAKVIRRKNVLYFNHILLL